jgi:hypothetical protein
MTDQLEMPLRILRAALRCAGENMRDIARPEPEVGAPDALHEVALLEGVPDERLGGVQRLTNVLRFFAESVRVAERNDRPILPLLRERFKRRRSTR